MFKINIETINLNQEEEVIVKCHQVDEKVLNLLNKLKLGNSDSLIGTKDEQIHSINLEDIYYVEATENKTFIYCEYDFYESKQKLYELETFLKDSSFFRCSKSVILNCNQIKYVLPSFNGRFEAKLKNDEKVIISRQYVPELKKKLGL